MTIIERCTNVRSQIQARNELKLAYKNAEAFRSRADELREVREGLSAAISRLDVLRVRGLLPAVTPSPVASAAIVAEYKAALAANPQEIGKDYGRLKRALEKLERDVIGVADKVVDTVRRDEPTFDETFLKQVEMIPGYQLKVANIRQQRNALLEGADPKQSSEALAQFLDGRRALRGLADNLKPNEFPSEVLEFFRAGRQGQGAPLEKFTTVVQDWLKQRGLMQNVRVTVVAR